MKSIKIKLNNVNGEKVQILEKIFGQLEDISKEYFKIRLNELETKTYKPFKDHYAHFRIKYPTLNSGTMQNHLHAIDSTIKGYVSWCKKKHKLVSFPENMKTSIPLRNDMFHFEASKTSKSFNAWFKFLRIYFPLNLCEYHLKALIDFESISDSSIIKDRNGNICLRLVFKTKQLPLNTNKSLGIDIGIAKPIVCSDGKQIGSGAYIKHKKIEFAKKRLKNQKYKQQILKKQSNWTADLNHKLSRELVEHCLSQGVNVLVLEKLKGTQLSNRKFRKFNWAFKDLLTKIEYKAQNAGLKVVGVNPAYTSQTCSSCGLKSKDNRKSQSLYVCSCGFKANADINAAKNILNLSVQNGLNMNPTICNAYKQETHGSLARG